MERGRSRGRGGNSELSAEAAAPVGPAGPRSHASTRSYVGGRTRRGDDVGRGQGEHRSRRTTTASLYFNLTGKNGGPLDPHYPIEGQAKGYST